jgi:hypothetical protein
VAIAAKSGYIAGDFMRVGRVKHYRIEKVAFPGGTVLKKKDILAGSDREAVDRAKHSADCPTCDVRKDGEVIGTVR